MAISTNKEQLEKDSLIESSVTSDQAARAVCNPDGSNVVGDSYSSGSGSIKTTDLNPTNTHYGSLYQETITNYDFATDKDIYIDVEGAGYIAGYIAKTGGADEGTIKVYATCQNDGTAASSCDYLDITQYGITALNAEAAASFTDDLMFQLNTKGLKYIWIEITSADTDDDSDWIIAVNKQY